MKQVQLLCLALGFALCCSITMEGQNDSSLASRVTEVLKAKEPGWKFVPAIESRRVPLVPSEKRILVGTWESPKLGGVSDSVQVFIYVVENSGEAAAWLEPVRNRQVAAGWQVSTYQIGDEGYLSKYKDGERFEIEFRRAKVVAKIAGNDLRRVKDFARCVIDQIPSN